MKPWEKIACLCFVVWTPSVLLYGTEYILTANENPLGKAGLVVGAILALAAVISKRA